MKTAEKASENMPNTERYIGFGKIQRKYLFDDHGLLFCCYDVIAHHIKRYFAICVSTLIRYKNCCKVPKM
jgi:hypothetical protein